MILRLRQLKESEEGQTLVLAALFGLVLMLCVLGTVNLGRAVYDKVQLQAAADSAAYSEAAVEGRVMNFTAYTNRAMVVHYASLMAATSYLSWIHFMYGGMKPLLTVLKLVPYVQVVARIVDQVLKYLVRFMDIAIGGYGPVPGLSMLLSAANIFLYAMQEGAWWAVWARLGRPVSPQAHSGDSAAHPYQAIWPDLIPLANQAVFSQARGHLTMAQDGEDLPQQQGRRRAAGEAADGGDRQLGPATVGGVRRSLLQSFGFAARAPLALEDRLHRDR